MLLFFLDMYVKNRTLSRVRHKKNEMSAFLRKKELCRTPCGICGFFGCQHDCLEKFERKMVMQNNNNSNTSHENFIWRFILPHFYHTLVQRIRNSVSYWTCFSFISLAGFSLRGSNPIVKSFVLTCDMWKYKRSSEMNKGNRIGIYSIKNIFVFAGVAFNFAYWLI